MKTWFTGYIRSPAASSRTLLLREEVRCFSFNIFRCFLVWCEIKIWITNGSRINGKFGSFSKVHYNFFCNRAHLKFFFLNIVINECFTQIAFRLNHLRLMVQNQFGQMWSSLHTHTSFLTHHSEMLLKIASTLSLCSNRCNSSWGGLHFIIILGEIVPLKKVYTVINSIQNSSTLASSSSRRTKIFFVAARTARAKGKIRISTHRLAFELDLPNWGLICTKSENL